MMTNKKKLCVTGYSSNIFHEFEKILSDDIDIIRMGRDSFADIKTDFSVMSKDELILVVPLDCDYYFFNHAVLRPARILDQSESEIQQGLNINLLSTVIMCEHILENNHSARICIMGSESGFKGSYDTSYFLAKSAINSYITERCVSYPEQQLIGIAPSVIQDTRMTQSRDDKDNLNKLKLSLPKKRFLFSKEIGKLVCDLLIINTNYLTNVVVRVDGGKFSRMKYN